MNKKDYVKIIRKKFKFSKKGISIALKQLDNYYEALNYKAPKHNYNVGDDVFLKKGTFIHGTYKNMDGLKGIVNNGLLSSWFVDGRLSKYLGCVGVWNLKKDYYLKDYINFYSGGTLEYKNIDGGVIKTEVVPYDKMNCIIDMIDNSKCFRWLMEQTKEARFLPSYVQDKVEIAVIFNCDNKYIETLKEGDILSSKIGDKDVRPFVNPKYYDKFIKDRKKKDDFFTDRESAIIFGIPACFIEGILVGREYEKDKEKLKEIKELLPNCYICNLDGKVISL